MNLKGIKMGVLGDSITQGVGVEHYENIYHQRLKRECEMREVYVDGISGTRIAPQHSVTDPVSFDMDFISRVDNMDEDCDLVLVFGGTNDYGHGDAPFGTKEDRTSDTYWGSCRVLCEKLIHRFPKSQIVFMTALHRWEEVREDRCFADYIAVLQSVLEEYSIPYIDMCKMAGFTPQVDIYREMYIPDGIHPNDAGHERMTARIKAFLESL